MYVEEVVRVLMWVLDPEATSGEMWDIRCKITDEPYTSPEQERILRIIEAKDKEILNALEEK